MGILARLMCLAASILKPMASMTLGQVVGSYNEPEGPIRGFIAISIPIPFAAFTATLGLKFGPRIEDAFDQV
jgi:hypothetical protein